MHSYLVDAKVGDVFEWGGSGVRCKITEIRDMDLEIRFRYLDKGTEGYTILPQDVKLVSDPRSGT